MRPAGCVASTRTGSQSTGQYFKTSELMMIEFESSISSATEFYQANYVPLISPLGLQHGKRVTLGRKDDRICRFCKRNDTEVSFGMDAHVIPLSLGNKVLFSNYECNDCNQFFGGGIENDLGNWSKPHRTLARIRGKKGVPTIKNAGSEQGWRIEYDVDGFKFTEFGNEPHFVIDEENRKVSFQLQRDPYTPVAVFKALVRIGLTIMPEANLYNFAEALSWIRENDHSKSAVVECPILSTFVPGPMPNDLIFVALMQRHESVTDLPFAFRRCLQTCFELRCDVGSKRNAKGHTTLLDRRTSMRDVAPPDGGIPIVRCNHDVCVRRMTAPRWR